MEQLTLPELEILEILAKTAHGTAKRRHAIQNAGYRESRFYQLANPLVSDPRAIALEPVACRLHREHLERIRSSALGAM